MDKLKKPLLIVAGCLIVFILAMFLLASCNKKKYTSEEFGDYLVKLAKDYYKSNKTLLPNGNGGKTNIGITTLIEKPEKFLKDGITCIGNVDVINNNGSYMYSPNINCSDGYKSVKLSNYLTSSDKIVTVGNGLYFMNNEYVFRGENVNNYLIFNNQIWRILKINSDGSIKIIETNYIIKNKKSLNKSERKNKKRASSIWDDRFNAEKNANYGFNDYVHENMNSRIKDLLENIYNNEYNEDVKGYIVPQNLCIGKRAETDAINDGSIECTNVLNDQYIGLLQLNEYINASLDSSCNSASSLTCANYNYLSSFNSTFWTITASTENSYSVYKVGSKIVSSSTNSSSTPRVVINLSSEVLFKKGDGSENNPFIIS